MKAWIKEHPFWTFRIYTAIRFIAICIFPSLKVPERLDNLNAIIFWLMTLFGIVILIRAITKKIKKWKEESKIRKAEREKELQEKAKREQKEKEFLAAIPEMIKNDTYPTIQIDIPLEKEEKAYWAYATAYIKEKKVTTRTNYSWITWSFKIVKWVRYRVWSIQHQSESHIEEYRADNWLLYITNRRFIFKWDKQVIEIKAKDMISMEVIWNTVKIFKNKWNAIKFEFLWEYNTFWAIMMWLNNKE